MGKYCLQSVKTSTFSSIKITLDAWYSSRSKTETIPHARASDNRAFRRRSQNARRGTRA